MAAREETLLAGTSGLLFQRSVCQRLCNLQEGEKKTHVQTQVDPPHPTTPHSSAALLTLIIMTFLCHNNTIRSVFDNSSHLRYRRQQREICHYLHERDGGFVIIERASLVITSLCWNINAARRHGEQRPTEETQILIWRLGERVFFFLFLATLLSRALIWQSLLTENLPDQHK